MVDRQGGNKEDRTAPRVFFEPGKRPSLEIDRSRFEIEDISETGLKFLVDKEISLTRNISGSIIFFKGDTIEIAGTLVWTFGNAVGMSFSEPIPYSVLDKNQRIAYLKTDMAIPQLIKTGAKEETRYTTKDLAKLGIERDTLKSWIFQGYIESSLKDGNGNAFSHFDLYLIKLFDHLVKKGIPEDEASLKIKILAKASSTASDMLFVRPYISFTSKVDFQSLTKEVRDHLFDLVAGKSRISKQSQEKLSKILKGITPVFLDKTKAKRLLAKEGKDKVLIVDLNKVRKKVDKAL